VTETVVIAGAGHAAGQVVASLRQKKFAGRIVLIGEEPWLPYQRPPLSKKFLAGELSAERLYFKPESFYDDPDIEVRLGTRITEIDRDNCSVTSVDGEVFTYNKLVLALGGRPRTLPLPGAELAGIHYLRGIDDVLKIQSEIQEGRRLVIVGAGYIGLEVAAVTAQLGLDVTVVEMEDRVMSRVVSPQLSEFYQQEHVAHGVTLKLSTGTSGFSGNGKLQYVLLDNGEKLPADLVVIGVGIVPNIELADAAGLATENGIVVDDHCRTSDPNIFAVGDCTFHPNDVLGKSLRLESVHNALEQAKTAASNICGENSSYAQVPWFWSDQYDLKLQIVGLSQGYDEVVMRGDPVTRSFACLYLRDGQLIAVDAVNSPRDFMQSKALIANRARIDPRKLANTEVALKDMS
jgi:3-phenylpropionate/trans-cinnamate dioxygenase ferredoxin reductase subunit